jgi:acyl-CoA synthetase (AMP-forming)/AMP-acid ligase II
MNETAAKEYWAVHADGTPVRTIADIIRRRAEATPEGVAIQEPGRLTTFRELDERSNQVAWGLLEHGIVAGDRVAYIGANGPSFLEVFYGAAKAGAIATSINNRLATREITQLLNDCEPRVVVADGDALALIDRSALPASVTLLLEVAGEGDESYEVWRDDHDAHDPHVPVDADDTALILYTSGTSGLPKGIMLTGRNFGCALYSLNQDIELQEDSVCAAPIPFFHIAGLGLALAANLNGGRLLLETAVDPPAVLRLLIDRRVSHAAVVPTVLQRLLALEGIASEDFSALRYIVYGASPIPLPVLKAATEVFGCKFLQSYGLTESTGGFTVLGADDHVAEEAFARRLTSAGKAMPDAEIRVVDPITFEDVPMGTRGEVLVRSPRIMKGYWRQPELTASVMVEGGWLRTGDGGSFDEDGYLYLHDRIKDMIISGGENIYPAEVESALTGHPDILEVAVIGVPSAEWGESPHAVVVRKPGSTLGEAALIEWSRGQLAHFKCPRSVTFVDTLPRTASGKLQKAKLREQH